VCFLYYKQYMTRMLQTGWILELDDTDAEIANAKAVSGFYM